MHSPGRLTSLSHTRGGPTDSVPHMKLAILPYGISTTIKGRLKGR